MGSDDSEGQRSWIRGRPCGSRNIVKLSVGGIRVIFKIKDIPSEKTAVLKPKEKKKHYIEFQLNDHTMGVQLRVPCTS